MLCYLQNNIGLTKWKTEQLEPGGYLRSTAVFVDSGEQNEKDSAFIMATVKRSIKVEECPVSVKLKQCLSSCNNFSLWTSPSVQSLGSPASNPGCGQSNKGSCLCGSIIPGVSACRILLGVQLRLANEEWQIPSLYSGAIPHFLKGIQID